MKKFATEIKWGVVFTLAALLWVVLEKAMGWHDVHIAQHAIYTNLFALIAIAIFVFALINKRNNDLGGKMTWVQGFVSGIIISIVIAILAPLSQYVTHEFISPHYFENAIANAVENAGMTQENATAWFNYNSYTIQAVFGSLAMGVVTSALVALVVKRK